MQNKWAQKIKSWLNGIVSMCVHSRLHVAIWIQKWFPVTFNVDYWLDFQNTEREVVSKRGCCLWLIDAELVEWFLIFTTPQRIICIFLLKRLKLSSNLPNWSNKVVFYIFYFAPKLVNNFDGSTFKHITITSPNICYFFFQI